MEIENNIMNQAKDNFCSYNPPKRRKTYKVYAENVGEHREWINCYNLLF